MVIAYASSEHIYCFDYLKYSMKRIAIPTTSVLALLLAVTSISAARSTHKTPAKCPPAHAHVLIADEQAQVYDEPFEEIYGCIHGSRHPQALGSIPKFSSQGGGGIELLRLTGTVVAYTEISKQEGEGGSARFLIIVRNLRTSKVLYKVPTGPSNKTEPNPDTGSGSARAIVVKSNGSVAWIAENYEKSSPSVNYYELHIIDRSGSQTIATGTEINPTSLALTGNTLYWTQSGKPMSVSLE
jgi:hypothetical protein